jgi:hypothetical protein
MNWNFWKTTKPAAANDENISVKAQMEGYYSEDRVYNPIIDTVWDGEKTPGELGAVENTTPDYLKLRLRAYDMQLKTDVIKIITGKFFKWVIGSGLKMQAEPNRAVLKICGYDNDLASFKKNVEPLFSLYVGSKFSDYNERDYLHKKAVEAFKTAFFGDCLCIIRYGEHGPNIQVIDGQQVQSPLDDKDKEEGNKIKHGIEMTPAGKYVAFYVANESDIEDQKLDFSHTRVKAYNSRGIKVAWMIYGDKHRIDHHRGIPRIASILEKAAKLDRYVEASVSKAEQTANVVYAFKHNSNSTGENILKQNLSSRKSFGETPESTYEKNGRTANALRQTTSGQVLNLAVDSDLIALSTDSEGNFESFYRAVFYSLCASVDIPPEVAMQLYEQNYSSSRAAINGWEHILEIYRTDFAKNFYQVFYDAWLDYQILTNKLNLPGYLAAREKGDVMAGLAFTNARFLGKKMPHIDPLKEAKAVRSMLGDNADALISREQATEALGQGDWEANFQKFEEEQKLIPTPKEDDISKNNTKVGAVASKPKG